MGTAYCRVGGRVCPASVSSNRTHVRRTTLVKPNRYTAAADGMREDFLYCLGQALVTLATHRPGRTHRRDTGAEQVCMRQQITHRKRAVTVAPDADAFRVGHTHFNYFLNSGLGVQSHFFDKEIIACLLWPHNGHSHFF